MKRNLRFIMTLFKLRLSHMMMYRLSFFGGFFVDGALFVLWLIMFNTIYSKVDTIGGWDKGQTIIFLGTFSLLNALNMTFYFFGVNNIPGKILSGELDHYLTKPVNPLLRLSFENINPGSAPLIFLSMGIIAYGMSLHPMVVNAGTFVLYGVFILLMTVLYYDMEVILRTVPFLVTASGKMEDIEGAAFNVCMRVPGVLFKGVLKVLFYLFLPYGIMATIPVQIITNTASGTTMAYGACITLFFTFFTFRFWKFGLKHYRSASS